MAPIIPRREDIPIELTWDLTPVFPSDQLWEETFASTERQFPALKLAQGTLGRSAQDLYEGLRRRDEIGAVVDRLNEYAGRRHCADMTDTRSQALSSRASSLAAAFAAATAFFTPEILAIPPDRLQDFYAVEPRLGIYRHYIDEVTSLRPHTRPAEVEQVLAGMADLGKAPERIYEMIYNADARLPTIRDAAGTPTQLTNGTYFGVFRRSPVRSVRQAAFEGMLGTFKQQQHTLAATLGAQVAKNVFLAKERSYPTALDAALGPAHIPATVYTTLIETVNRSLPSLHRYLALRGKALALDTPQHMYDLDAPLVPAVTTAPITFEAACARLRDAVAPLGPVYTAILERAFRSRWIDVIESAGKLAGAYSAGTYGTPPFVSLNYQGTPDDVFTLAHEMGHALHSYLTWDTQPYHYSAYASFVAETASTLNEALLRRRLLETTEDAPQRAALVAQYLEHVRFTFFRQTLFAEFELSIHRHVEVGDALTAETLCALYRALNVRYYGGGGIVVDDLIAWEWSILPHFYGLSFYVYQYATGHAASAALARQILHDGQPAVDRYLRLLRAGSSDYAITLLADAGVDMTTSAPIDAAIAEFEQYVSELEKLL